MHEPEFSDRTILVTGATGGIGRRVSRLICERAGTVLLVGRNPQALTALDGSLNQTWSSGPRTLVVDFAVADSVARGAEALRLGRLPLRGVVLICPSVPKSEAIIPADTEWREALDLCFVNPLSLLRAALENMTADGRIVIVSGIASLQVFPSLPITNVVRMAWLGQAKYLAIRLGERRIRVNTVSLGGTLTEQFAARLASRQTLDVPPEESPDSIALGEYGDPDDAAYVVVSLLSRFTNHITGTNVVFDGGLTRGY
jgi:3-oxoacyl-[acyl-carrier protein] reductase